MPFKKFARQQPGKPISAKVINAPLDAIEAGLGVRYTSPLNATTLAGATTVQFDQGDEFVAKVTAGSGAGPYQWQEMTPGSSGAWTVLTGGRTDNSGNDPAYNSLGTTPGTLPLIVPMRRGAAGGLYFTA